MSTDAVPVALPRARRFVLADWRWLFVAALLLPFANMRLTMPVAAWLAPTLLLRFVRTNRTSRAFIATLFAIVAALSVQFAGMIPAPALVVPLIVSFYAIVFFVPFLIDAWFLRRISSTAATLVFPLAWTACEYATTFSPYSSWASIAYTQYGNLTLMQMVSVTGLYGITFTIGAFASVVNHAWEHGFVWREARRPVIAFVALIAAIGVFGSLRLSRPGSGPTVRVASFTSIDLDVFPDAAIRRRLTRGESLSAGDLAAIRHRQRMVNADLLARMEREAAAGARILFTGEANASVLKSDEAGFLRASGALARRHNAYIVLGLATLLPGQKKWLENKAVLINPNGDVEWAYLKARPVPGGEAAGSVPSDGRIRFSDTPFGRIASAICFDLDDPAFLRQAGKARTDILLAPSNDWQAIDPWHTQMAVFRAVENGFALVRHTSHGLSLATDHKGRTIAAMDHFMTKERVLVSELPTRGVGTIYSRYGDWLPITALIVLFALGVLGRAPQSNAVARDVNFSS